LGCCEATVLAGLSKSLIGNQRFTGIRLNQPQHSKVNIGNLDRILNDISEHLQESPFEEDKIIEVLKTVFTR
jgi:hypothetical protein